MKRTSLYFTAPRQIELRQEEVPAPGEGQVQVQTSVSALSSGTEMLIYRAEAPAELDADSSLAALSGKLAYPLKYGYSAVGKTSDGRRVFAFNPHETNFNASSDDLLPVPEGVSDEDAAFLPNVETAVNLMLDGELRLGENVAVLGQGMVGLLATAVLSKHPLNRVITIDSFELRRKRSLEWGATHSLEPDSVKQALSLLGPRRADLVYELSGQPAALDLALNLVGEHGRVVVGSWYGERRAAVDLGGHFHRGRIKLISSQVSQIEPALRGRWDRARRFEVAWKLLAEVKPSRLITHRFPFAQAAEAYKLLAERPQDALGVIFQY